MSASAELALDTRFRPDVAERIAIVDAKYLRMGGAWYAGKVDPDVFVFAVDAVDSVLPVDATDVRIPSNVRHYGQGVRPVQEAVLETILQEAGGSADQIKRDIEAQKTLDDKLDRLQDRLLWDFFDGQNMHGSGLDPAATVAANLVISHARGFDRIQHLAKRNAEVSGNDQYMHQWYREYFEGLKALKGINTANGAALDYDLSRDTLAVAMLDAGRYSRVAQYSDALGLSSENGISLFDEHVTKGCLLAGKCLELGFNTRGRERQDRGLLSSVEVTGDELITIARNFAAGDEGKLGDVQFADLKHILTLDKLFANMTPQQSHTMFEELIDIDPALGFALYSKYRKGIFQSYELFGPNNTRRATELVDGVTSGDLTPAHVALGVTKKGKNGLAQLRTTVEGVTDRLLAPNKTYEEIGEIASSLHTSDIYATLARAAFNFDQSQWRRNVSKDSFIDVFNNYTKGWGHGTNRQDMPAAMQPSEIYEIGAYEKRAGEVEPLSEKLIVIYDLFPHNRETFEAMTGRTASLATIEETIRASYERELSPEELKELARQMVEHVYDNRFGDTTNHALRDAYVKMGKQDLRVERIDQFIEVVGHMNIDVGLDNLEPENRDQLRQLLKLDEFEAYANAARENATLKPKGTHLLQLIPNNDVGFDFAGDIGDACYNRIYNAGARHPNMTAVLMNDRTEGRNRLVGSMLLIKATDYNPDGGETLIMRAVNPRETWLKKHSDSEVIKTLIDYTQTVADALDARPAMVVDKPTGAATNRRGMFDAMVRYRRGKSPLKLDPKEVTFNDYDLRGSVFYID